MTTAGTLHTGVSEVGALTSPNRMMSSSGITPGDSCRLAASTVARDLRSEYSGGCGAHTRRRPSGPRGVPRLLEPSTNSGP